MDFIHCNKCGVVPGPEEGAPPHYQFTSCGHIICGSCSKKVVDATCVVCKAKSIRTIDIQSQSHYGSEVRRNLKDPLSIIEDTLKKTRNIYHFQFTQFQSFVRVYSAVGKSLERMEAEYETTQNAIKIASEHRRRLLQQRQRIGNLSSSSTITRPMKRSGSESFTQPLPIKLRQVNNLPSTSSGGNRGTRDHADERLSIKRISSPGYLTGQGSPNMSTVVSPSEIRRRQQLDSFRQRHQNPNRSIVNSPSEIQRRQQLNSFRLRHQSPNRSIVNSPSESQRRQQLDSSFRLPQKSPNSTLWSPDSVVSNDSTFQCSPSDRLAGFNDNYGSGRLSINRIRSPVTANELSTCAKTSYYFHK